MGPSLQLGVSAAGQDTLAALNTQLTTLRTNLAALKSGKVDLSSLAGANAEIKSLRGEFAESGAALRTSFAELAEAIRGGFTKASAETEAGGSRTRGIVAAQRANYQREYEGWIKAQRDLSAEELRVIRDAGVKLTAEHLAIVQAQTAASRSFATATGTRIISNPLPAPQISSASATQIDAAYAQRDKLIAEEAAQIRTSNWKRAQAAADIEISAAQVQGFKGFAAIERQMATARVAEAKESASAVAAGIKANDVVVRAIEVEAAKEVAAIEAAALRVKTANARYMAATQQQQAGLAVGARAQLNSGIAAPVVTQNFGQMATQAAQAAASIDVLKEAHAKLGAESGVTGTKIKGLSAAMNDLHSASRGVASGFGAMFLTWGNLAPLLAGAALSNAFVQTVRLGSSVEQTLGIIRELSSETSESVGGLRDKLLALAANGPQGPLEIAKAMKALSLAGLDAAQVSTSVSAALTLSVVGEMPAEKAAEALVAISTAYGYSSGQFSRVNDVIAKTAAISMSSVTGMTDSFRVSSVVAQQYGVSLEDVATQLGLLANIGIRNQQAGTSVTQFYANLSGTTKKGADAIKALIGTSQSLRDEVTGRFKSLSEVIDILNGSLTKLKPLAQTAALSDIFNNRGQRDAAATLLASRKPSYDDAGNVAKDAAGNIITEYQKVALAVNEAYGFAAIAMANLSLTSENEMKSVVASFQGTLVKAFQDLEPAIFAVSMQLKTAFNSESFQSTLGGMVNSVGNLIVAFVTHADVIKLAAEAWLIYKGATVSAAIFSAVTAGVTGLYGALVALRAGTLLAASGFAVLQGAMGVIGLVLGALAAAWLYYKATSSNASITSADIATAKADEIVSALNKESDRLEARNRMIRDGTSAREADIRVAAIQAQADLEVRGQKARTEVQDKITPIQNQIKGINDLQESAGGFLTRAQITARLQLQSQLNGLLQQQKLTEDQIVLNKIKVQVATDRQVAAAKEAAKLGPEKPPIVIPGGNKDFNTKIPKPTALARDELAGLRTVYQAEESEAKKYYDGLEKLESARHSSGLISDIQYQIESEQNQQASYNRQSALLEKFAKDSAKAFAVLEQDPTKKQKAVADERRLNIELEQQRQALSSAQQLIAVKKEGEENKSQLAITKFIEAQNTSLDVARQAIDLQQSTATLTTDQIAQEQARVAEKAKFNDKLREEVRLLKQAQDYLALAKSAQSDMGGGNEDAISAAQREVTRRQKDIADLNTAAEKAGNKAAENKAATQKPTWQTTLEGWTNTTQRMQVMYDTVVEGFISKGQDMWQKLVTTGKVSATDLLTFLRDTVIKEAYQRTIAPAMAQMGNSVAEALFPGGKRTGAVSPIDTAAMKTATSLELMNSAGVSPLSTGFARLMVAAQAAADTLMRIAFGGGGGGGASIGGALSSAFSGGSLSNSGYSSSTPTFGGGDLSDVGTGIGGLFPSVKGNVFDNGYRFAKGSAFTNGVYDRPTNFHFANGGGFSQGQMAEAGPEAVMPLKRGADGALGVAMHGGGSSSSSSANVSVVVENHSDGKARTEETQRGDGSREIRVIVEAAVEATAQSVRGGGIMGSAIEGQYGVNRANGLPRRSR